MSSEEPRQRPRMQLSKRSAGAGAVGGYAKAAGKSSIFGGARTREEVLAAKGIDVKAQEKALERKIALENLGEEQQQEYKDLKAEASFAKNELAKAEDDEAKAAAEAEVKKTEDAIAAFEALAIKPKKVNPNAERPSERRTKREEYARPDGADFSSFGRRGGDRDCYNCGETGHISRECPNGRDGGRQGDFSSFGGRSRGGDRDCYNCGEVGHISRDCPNGGRQGDFSSFSGRGRGGDRDCYNCGEPGHISRECPNGGRQGDFSSFGGRGGGDRDCYNCGEVGHISRDCPNGRGDGRQGDFSSFGGRGGDRDCYNCGEPGHISRECPNGRDGGRQGDFSSFGGRGGGDRDCYNCGEVGHISRDCPNGGGGGRGGDRDCYNCGEPGHISRECPNGRR